jgi:hypothetical protein
MVIGCLAIFLGDIQYIYMYGVARTSLESLEHDASYLDTVAIPKCCLIVQVGDAIIPSDI